MDALVGHHLLLFKGDFNRLKILHPHESATSVIRTLVREHIRRMEEAGPSEAEGLREFV